MSDERLTDELALRILGWRMAPDRYLKSGRSWIARSRFQPLTSLDDAFLLLEKLMGEYSLTSSLAHGLLVEVWFNGQVGRASGKNAARAVSFAVARAIGIDIPGNIALSPAIRNQRDGRTQDGERMRP